MYMATKGTGFMKKGSRLWRAAGMAVLMSACTATDVLDEGESNDVICFRSPALTRAAVESFAEGDRFSVWAWHENATAATARTPVFADDNATRAPKEPGDETNPLANPADEGVSSRHAAKTTVP